MSLRFFSEYAQILLWKQWHHFSLSAVRTETWYIYSDFPEIEAMTSVWSAVTLQCNRKGFVSLLLWGHSMWCFSSPLVQITVTETVMFLVQYTSKELDSREKNIVTGDCCYLNPLVRRTFRFLGKCCLLRIEWSWATLNLRSQVYYKKWQQFFQWAILPTP